jgi:hypothetical protein
VEQQRGHCPYNFRQSELPYNPLLVTCFDGLIEEKHPYGFIAFNVCKDMIEDEVQSALLSNQRRNL